MTSIAPNSPVGSELPVRPYALLLKIMTSRDIHAAGIHTAGAPFSNSAPTGRMVVTTVLTGSSAGDMLLAEKWRSANRRPL